jgi:glycosyltransferase involved in cell wall biosynthesis
MEHGLMRVAFVTPFCPHYRRPLFSEMGRRMDLTLIFTSRGNEWYWQGERPFDTGGVPMVRATGPLKVRRVLREGGYDAVISALTGRATLLSVVRTARASRLPLVLWVGIWEHPRTLAHRFSRPLARRLYRSAGAIVTYGPHVSYFIERESGRTDNVFVAAQAVENERFRTPVPPAAIRDLRHRLDLDGRPTFTFVGRLTEEKGLDVLMEACARVEVPHQVVVAGNGPLLDSTRALASSLGIDERVRFVGYIEQAELPTLLRASDALVLPSVSTSRVRETWGLVVNEAMNCQLPVIATEAVGAAAGGLVAHQETGLVVPEHDADALASALENLANDEPERRRLGHNASARVVAWNYGAAADAFDAALAEATAGSHANRRSAGRLAGSSRTAPQDR